MTEWFGRLPAAARVLLAAGVMAAATAADLAFVAKVSPMRIDVAIAAALGALAACPFTWRVRSRLQNVLLITGIVAFGTAMVWARVNGHLASSFAFIFSVVLVSLPVQRARGRSAADRG